MEIIYKFLKNDHTSKFQFPRLPARHIKMPDFVIIMICKATNTSEQKFSVFYLTGRTRKLNFFLMKGISHISGILIYWE